MIWNLILKIKSALKKQTTHIKYISVTLSSEYPPKINFNSVHDLNSMIIDFEGSNDIGDVHIVVQDPFCVKIRKNQVFQEKKVAFLSTYLPYALISYFSRKHKKCYTVSHFAQTLDGRIASSSGDSKWIGNEENLVHSHRMRALCDGILVGAHTLHIDNPSLNVRLVKGNNPIKIIIGGDHLDFEAYKAIDKNTIIFCQNHSDFKETEQRIILTKNNGEYSPKDLLNTLYQKGLDSVYIEGGSYTTSVFIKQHAVDQVQVHITPKIIGSGLIGFQFDGLNSIKEAIQFTSYRFVPVGDHIMFIGELDG